MNYLSIGHEKIRRRFHERFLSRAILVIVAAILKSVACPGAIRAIPLARGALSPRPGTSRDPARVIRVSFAAVTRRA